MAAGPPGLLTARRCSAEPLGQSARAGLKWTRQATQADERDHSALVFDFCGRLDRILERHKDVALFVAQGIAEAKATNAQLDNKAVQAAYLGGHA